MAADEQRGCTDIEADQLTYDWEVRGLNLLIQKTGEFLKSPVFSMGKDKVQWNLELCPKTDIYRGGSLGRIGLRLVSPGSASLDIGVKYKISVSQSNTEILPEYSYQLSYTSLTRDELPSFETNKLLDACKSNDSFIVHCKLVRPLTKLNKPEDNPKLPTHNEKLVNSCRQLFQEPHQFHDVTIIVEDKRFPAHKVFLAIRSPIFAAMFTNKEWKENQTNEVKIEHTAPEVIEAMLEYIYTDEVKNLSEVASRLIAVAHKYELQSLKTMCEEVLWKALKKENAYETVELANLYGSDELIVFVNKFIMNNFREVVESAYDKIDDSELLQKIMGLIINKKKE